MSVVSREFDIPSLDLRTSLLTRLFVAAAAVTLVSLGLAVIAYLVFATGLISTHAPRNPFLTGAAGFAMASSGIGSIILTVQAEFYGALTAAVQALKADGVGLMSLAIVGFLYGIFHAAGPGHGKGVISGYIIASKSSILHGLVLSLAAALLQAIVAIGIVGLFAIVLKATAATINATARNIELVSFAAVAGLGVILIWAKASEFLRCLASIRSGSMPTYYDERFQFKKHTSLLDSWRIFVGVVLAAGIRPCSGAIILLIFSVSQDMFAAGVIGAIAMAIGTSITTGTLASLTVFAKSLLHRLAARKHRIGLIAFAAFELLAAAFVLTLGSMLFVGVWAGGMFSALD